MNTKPVSRNLPVPLTIDEKVEKGRELANLHAEYSRMEVDKKAAADQFKNELELIDGRIAHVARIIRNGEEYRDVECAWRYLFETNTKELIRMDSGEIVETEAITADERQMMLQMESQRESDAAVQR